MEITIVEILICIIIVLSVSYPFIILWIYPYIANRIHNAYHKGYNEHRNDKINYYETLREINDDFTSLMKKINDSGLLFEIDLVNNLIDFGNKIRKFKNKN